jgi:hypothetical protein
MQQNQQTRRDDVQLQETVLVDGLLRNGVDTLAARRAHLRNLTMARQAAERRHERHAMARTLDQDLRPDAARSRANEFRMELSRLDSVHRVWLQDQGEDVPVRRTRLRRAALPHG